MYLHGPGDAGSRLLFKVRYGTHGLNEELGRHRGREGRKECLLCGDECESVSYALWECPAYNIYRNDFTAKLQDFLGEGFKDSQSLDSLPLHWAVSSARNTFHLSLSLLRGMFCIFGN